MRRQRMQALRPWRTAAEPCWSVTQGKDARRRRTKQQDRENWPRLGRARAQIREGGKCYVVRDQQKACQRHAGGRGGAHRQRQLSDRVVEQGFCVSVPDALYTVGQPCALRRRRLPKRRRATRTVTTRLMAREKPVVAQAARWTKNSTALEAWLRSVR